MKLRNEKVINKEYAASDRKKIQPENMRKRQNKKESKSSESYEQTNISESNGNKKSKDQNRFNKKESQRNESEKMDDKKRQNKFLERKRERSNNDSKENERRDNMANITENYGRNKITFIDISESESEDESIIETHEKKKESPEEIRKRTIFVKYYGEKIKESNLYEIFKVYGSISKVKLKSKRAGLVEFKDKNSINRIMNKKKNIYFNGKQLKINSANDIIQEMREKSLNNIKKGLSKQKEKIVEKFIDINENLEEKNISKIEELEKKEKKNERYIDIELGKEKIEGYDNATLTKIVNNLIIKFSEYKEEIKDIKISLNIMDEIDKQKDFYYKTQFNNINKNMRLLLNSYKVLFIRKLANLLLDEIYSNYSEFLIKVGIRQKTIIAVNPKISGIGEIPCYQINLLIDFLRFIWEKCSSAIHINDENFPLQKEIFYEYLRTIKKTSDKIEKTVEPMEINDIIGLIFEKKNENTSNPDKNDMEDSHLIKEIKNKIKFNTPKSNNIKMNNDEDDIFTISLPKPGKIDESNDKINENEIKKIIQENIKEIDISSKIAKLIGLIKMNQEEKKNIKDNIEEINGKYLYNLWKNSFINLKYKKNKEYIKYNPKDKIMSLEQMGLLVCNLLKGITITLFVHDPTNIDKNIEALPKFS